MSSDIIRTVIHLILFFGSIAALLALIVSGITSYLVIDDIAQCPTPDPLVAQCAPADAIVAISGGDTPARAEEAIKLYHAGWAPTILFSGAALDTAGPSNAAAMRRQALAAGVPESAIVIDETSTDTAQNASRAFILLQGSDRMVLVTSPYHQRRANIEFQQVFGQGVEIVDRPTQSDHIWTKTWYLTANGWWLAVSETAKTFIVSL
jgi:uncharacterized SAM-binding protein YcdF (DUF218 family)